ncbi:hypothetical protein ACI6Q2_21640 [Chitinophagaceae bacterium LWZ2-11]
MRFYIYLSFFATSIVSCKSENTKAHPKRVLDTTIITQKETTSPDKRAILSGAADTFKIGGNYFN